MKNALTVDVADLNSLLSADFLELTLQLLDLDEFLVPACLKGARNDSVVRVTGVELPLGTSGLVASALQSQSPLLLERRVLLFDDLDDGRCDLKVLSGESLEDQFDHRPVDEPTGRRDAVVLRAPLVEKMGALVVWVTSVLPVVRHGELLAAASAAK